MQIKLLNEIVSDVVGKQGSEILDLLIGKKDVNEFIIAKKLKLTINQVRNILYKLSNYSLVTFNRKKDRRKGWYTYFWTLDNERALELLDKKIQSEIENLKQQLKSREIKRFYTCNTCKTEVSEETALLHNFVCQECGEVYSLADNHKIIESLKNSISRLERQRIGVLSELGSLREEHGKRRVKQAKRFEKARKKKMREKREKARKLEPKKIKKKREKAGKKKKKRKRGKKKKF